MTLLLQAQSSTSRCPLSHSFLKYSFSMCDYCIMPSYGQVNVAPFVILVYIEDGRLEETEGKPEISLQFVRNATKT